jgi:hypothetical protein
VLPSFNPKGDYIFPAASFSTELLLYRALSYSSIGFIIGDYSLSEYSKFILLSNCVRLSTLGWLFKYSAPGMVLLAAMLMASLVMPVSGALSKPPLE